MEVLKKLRPDFWFSSHMHVKFSALVRWNQGECRRCDEGKAGNRIPGATKFLALDKCLPRRHFLQIMTIQPREEMKMKGQHSSGLMYDKEWLEIVKRSHHLIEIKGGSRNSTTTKKEDSTPDYSIPNNFVRTVSLDESEVKLRGNPQTDMFLKRLGLGHGALTVPFDNGKGDENGRGSPIAAVGCSGSKATSFDAESGGENSDDDNEIDLDDV